MSSNIKASNFTNKYQYKFSNSRGSFTLTKYRISANEKNKLISNLKKIGLTSKEINDDIAAINGKWRGSCYGLSISSGINFMKQININKYIGKGTKNGYALNKTGLPKNNIKLESLINYYHGIQLYARLKESNYFYSPEYKSNYKVGINKLLNNAKNNKLQILSLQSCKTKNCSLYYYHTVIVKNYIGKTAKGESKLLVYDSNYPSQNSYLLISKNLDRIMVLNHGIINNFEISTDFGVFKDFDIDN
jgi:hypothetical protein